MSLPARPLAALLVTAALACSRPPRVPPEATGAAGSAERPAAREPAPRRSGRPAGAGRGLEEEKRIRADLLLSQRGCTACHPPPREASQRLAVEHGPALDLAGELLRPAWLARFLDDPFTASGETDMPDVLPRGPEQARARAEAVEDLVHFLVSRKLGDGPSPYRALLGAESSPAPASPAAGRQTSALAIDRIAVDPIRLEQGRQLFHSVGCVACHAPIESPEDLELPLWSFDGWSEDARPIEGERSLAGLPSEYTPALARSLGVFLARGSGPLWPAEMPSLRLTDAEADAIAAYLTAPEVRPGAPGFGQGPGLVYEYHEGEIDGPASAGAATRVRTGVTPDLETLPEHRDEHYAFRFRGFLEVPASGTWTFALSSDDGSWLSIDGRVAVDCGGVHALSEVAGDVSLEAGRHALELFFFEWTGDDALALEWSGPDTPRGPIPAAAFSHWERLSEPPEEFELDPARVERGAARFRSLGCAVCHVLRGPPARPPGPPLAELDPRDPQGCLAPEPGPGRARPALDDGERALLVEALSHPEALTTPLEPGERLRRDLTRLECLACHVRDGAGGPSPERARYFRVARGLDLGDQGRLPPPLTGVGAKLEYDALEGVLLRGETVRDYVLTRMPQFGGALVGHLPGLFATVDPPLEAPPEPDFDRERAEIGRQLAGTHGLSCVGCHRVAGYDSLGIPAVDLATAAGRLQWPWFHKLLLDPRSLGMNSRMPIFWDDEGQSPVADVLDGDPERQVEALWTWLSLGDALPLPEGLVTAADAYELVPDERPVLVGVFMAGVSPRTVCVGHPERLHYAFDVGASRLAKVWRGRFFDARGTWHGRAGELESPPSDDVLDLPAGPTFARLAAGDDPWPSPDEERPRVLGRTLDPQGLPTFRYALGPVTIEESPRPEIAAGGARLVRRFRVTSTEPVGDLWLRVAAGRAVGALEPDRRFSVDGGAWSVTLRPPPHAQVELLPDEARVQVPVRPDQPAELELEVSW